MIRDFEGNAIRLTNTPNPHILITGKSGYGKTFLCNRLIEWKYIHRKRIAVIDDSCSFSPQELQKHSFSFMKDVMYFDICEKETYFIIQADNYNEAAEKITASISEAFHISSYIQKEILLAACKSMLTTEQKFRFSRLFTVLAQISELKNLGSDEKQNILKLIKKIYPFKEIKNLVLILNNKNIGKRTGIEIFQFSGLSAMQRNTLSSFLLSILWNEIRDLKRIPLYDVLVVDEFQHLSMHKNSSLYGILQEGRKFNLQLILSSQYIQNYSKDEMEALMQVGTSFFFHPTDKDARIIAKSLSENDLYEWQELLQSLNRGEAILRGNYKLKGKKRLLSDPLLVRVDQI